MDRTGSAAGKNKRCGAVRCTVYTQARARCVAAGGCMSVMYPFAGSIAFEGLLLLYCICGVGSSACGCGAGLAIIIRSSSRRWCGGSWKHKGKLRIACLLLLVLAALTNQSRRFGFRLSLSFFFPDGPQGNPCVQQPARCAPRRPSCCSSPTFRHCAQRIWGLRIRRRPVERPASALATAGRPACPPRPPRLPASQPQPAWHCVARRPTSQLLQRAYVCVVLPCTLLRRIERDPPCRLPRARSKASALLRWDGDVGRKEPHGTTTPRRSAGATIAFLFYLKCRL
jgi:hypothetical protein